VSQKQGILEWEFALHMPVALLVPLDSCPNSSWFVASAVHYCFNSALQNPHTIQTIPWACSCMCCLCRSFQTPQNFKETVSCT